MSEIIIYKTQDNKTQISLKVEDDTVWLSQGQLAELFDSSKSSISDHIKNIFESNELNEASVVRIFRTTTDDGKNYNVKYYNLDMILAIGYRVRSISGINIYNYLF